MRVLLVGVTSVKVMFHIGYLCLYSYVKHRMPDVEMKIIEEWNEDSLKELIDFKPDLVGISSMTPNYEAATRAAKQIKAHDKTIPIILGGTHITLLPESFRECFDIGVIGEGEDVLCDLLALYKKEGTLSFDGLSKISGLIFWKNGTVEKTPPRGPVDLEKYPDLDYSIIPESVFQIKAIGAWGKFGVEGFVETSRGCPYKCIFCASTRFWNRIRYFTVEWITRNISALVARGCTHICLTDDLFAVNKKRLRSIADSFAKAGIQKRAEFACTARTSMFDDEICDLLKSCGCTSLFFGFESGNPRMLQVLKGESCSLDKSKEAIKICYAKKIDCWGSVMIGSPTETLHEMRDTVNFIKWCKKYGVRRIGVGVTTPYPGTPLWDMAVKMGITSPDMDFKMFEPNLDYNEYGVFVPKEDVEEFLKIRLEANRAAHSFKWNKAWSLFKSGPIRILSFALHSPWWIIKRMFDPRIP